MDLEAYVPLPGEEVGDCKANIIGVLFAGGRDMHPRFYGEELKGAKVNLGSEERYYIALKQYRWAQGHVPIMGICWGSQFLLVASGGTLLQHLSNAKEHLFAPNLLRFEHRSWLQTTTGSSEIVGQCVHHQGYARIPKRFKPIAWDAQGLPHAFQSIEGLPELGLLFHPEQLIGETGSKRIAAFFGEACLRAREVVRKSFGENDKSTDEDEPDEVKG